MSKKEIVSEATATIPPTLSTQATEGVLEIRLQLGGAANEYAKEIGHESPEESIGCMTIEAKIRVGDLKTKDIIGAEPEQFLENGVIAGILDALRVGLNQPRGINFNEAVEQTTEKAHDAHRIVNTLKLLKELESKVGDIALKNTEPQGNA